MREQAGVVLTVARDRTLARIELAYLGFNMAEYATWVAILVYAYGLGGAGVAGIVALVQLLPAGLIAPFAAYAGDRFRPDRVLFAGYLVQATTMAATAVALYSAAPAFVVIGVATTAAAAITVTRPVQATMLPAITHSPGDLTAANTVSGLAEGMGLCFGPLVAGLLLGRSGPGDVFAVFAVVSFANALLVARNRLEDGSTSARPPAGVRRILADSFGGIGVLRRHRPVRLLVLLLTASMLVLGALDILFVAVAIELLGAGESWAGFLLAAFGLGAIVGALGAVALVGRRRLTPALAGSGTLYGALIAAIAVIPSIPTAAGMFALSGAGLTINGVAGRTMLQRVTPETTLARVFGVLEGLTMFALALGSIVTGLVIEVFDVRSALVAAGLLVPVLIVLTWRELAALDRDARPPDLEALALLRRLPIFAPLSAPSMERILAELTWLELPAGHVLIRQGDPGDRFYVIADGRVEVTQDGAVLSRPGPGEHLGEIALLRDVPRTATVTALTPLRVIAIERERFLEAVTGHAQSRQRAEAVATERLGNTGRG